MSKVTLEELAAQGACAEGLAVLRSTFGESGEVTPEACLSVAHQIPWGQAAQKLLPHPALREFLAACGRSRNPQAMALAFARAWAGPAGPVAQPGRAEK